MKAASVVLLGLAVSLLALVAARQNSIDGEVRALRAELSATRQDQLRNIAWLARLQDRLGELKRGCRKED